MGLSPHAAMGGTRVGYTPRISRALHALNNECVREASERPTAWSWRCRLNTEQQSEQKDKNIKMRGRCFCLELHGPWSVERVGRWCGSASAESESDQLVE